MGVDVTQLARHRTIDLTTYGRSTGLPRRIEIWWFLVDGRMIITGTPGPRDWLANVRKTSEIIVHVDGRDLEASAREITASEDRRAVFAHPDTRWYSTQAELDRLVAESPMIEVIF